MKKILTSKYGLLIFSLLGGLSYFILVMMLISKTNYSSLLGLFFFPAIVCGGALCLFKTIRNMEEAKEFGKIKSIMVIHIFVFLLALAYAVTSVITKF